MKNIIPDSVIAWVEAREGRSIKLTRSEREWRATITAWAGSVGSPPATSTASSKDPLDACQKALDALRESIM